MEKSSPHAFDSTRTVRNARTSLSGIDCPCVLWWVERGGGYIVCVCACAVSMTFSLAGSGRNAEIRRDVSAAVLRGRRWSLIIVELLAEKKKRNAR